MKFKLSIRFFYLLFVLCWSLPATAQQRGEDKSLTYGFVSPNTREGLKLGDAIRGLTSREEEALLRNARRLDCVTQSKIGVIKAIGSWSDGAEHSLLLRLRTNESTMRYVVSVLGRNAEQKAALYFHSNIAGPAEMYTLRSRGHRGPLSRLARVLDQAGIEFRTLVPTKASVIVYVVDLKREMRAKITAAAKRLRTRVVSRRGSAEFIGDDSSREKARTVFDEEIRNFENKNPDLLNKCQRQTVRDP